MAEQQLGKLFERAECLFDAAAIGDDDVDRQETCLFVGRLDARADIAERVARCHQSEAVEVGQPLGQFVPQLFEQSRQMCVVERKANEVLDDSQSFTSAICRRIERPQGVGEVRFGRLRPVQVEVQSDWAGDNNGNRWQALSHESEPSEKLRDA